MRSFDTFPHNGFNFPFGERSGDRPGGHFGRRGDHPQHPGRHGGPHGGFPPEFGPGFRPDPRMGELFGHGRGKGRGGRAGRGDLRTAILLLLNEEPMHGYQLMTTIGERTDGHWTPSPGAIYPTISMLEDEGLIDITKEAGRKLATITEAGAELVKQKSQEWADFFAAYKQTADSETPGPEERNGEFPPFGPPHRRGGRGPQGGRGPRGGEGPRNGRFFGNPELMESVGALGQALFTLDTEHTDAAREILEQAIADITALSKNNGTPDED